MTGEAVATGATKRRIDTDLIVEARLVALVDPESASEEIENR